MAVVPRGYVFWDVSANKSYSWGQTMPALGEGDYLIPATTTYDGYYQQYIYHKNSRTIASATYGDAWEGMVQAQYRSRSDQRLPFGALGGKPVRWFDYYGCTGITKCPTINNAGETSSLSSIGNLRWIAFGECTNLTSAPTLPLYLASLHKIFFNTKITSVPSNLTSLTQVTHLDWAFTNTKITTYPDISNKTTILSMKGAFEGCTSLTTTNPLPKNVTDIGWIFKNCTKISSAPKIPSKVSSIYQAFYGCSNLSGTLFVDSPSISNSYESFKNTTKQIILLGDTNEKYTVIRNIAAPYSNVYPGAMPTIKSFTAIRGVYESGEFIERATGEYCLLTCSFTAPYLENAKLKPPILKRNGEDLIVNWSLNTLEGTPITSTGIQLPSSGKTVSVINVGTASSETFELQLYVDYQYSSSTNIWWKTGAIFAELTYSEFVIDINSLGTGLAIGKESEKDGIEIGWNHLYLESDLEILDPDTFNLSDRIVEYNTSDGWVWKKYSSGRYEAEKILTISSATASVGIATLTSSVKLYATPALPANSPSLPHTLVSGKIVYSYLSNTAGYAIPMGTSQNKIQLGRLASDGTFVFSNIEILCRVVNGTWK